MNELIARITQLLEREEGQALAEYALILGFVAMVCIGALSFFGQAILEPFTNLASSGFGSGS